MYPLGLKDSIHVVVCHSRIGICISIEFKVGSKIAPTTSLIGFAYYAMYIISPLT